MNQPFWEKCLAGGDAMGEVAEVIQMKLILDVMAEAVTVYDPHGKILLANQAAQEIWRFWGFEKPPESQWEYGPHDLSIFNEGREIRPEEAPSARVLRGEHFSGYEVQIRIKETGRVFYYRFNGTPVYDDTGNLRVGIVTVSDITEWKQTEENSQDTAARSQEIVAELPESEQKYKDLIQYAPAVIYEVDIPNNRLRSVNDELCHLTGYTKEELLNMNPNDLLEDESKILFQARINDLLAGIKPDEHIEYKVMTKNGQMLYVDLNVHFSSDENGKPIGTTVIGHDITDRIRSEEKIQRQNAILEGINRILQAALTCLAESELGLACLAIAKDLTESKLGFIGVLNLERKLDNPLISDSGWDLCWMGELAGNGWTPKGLKIQGIYRKVLLEGNPLLINNPDHSPDGLGLPEGHPPLTAFLGIPLFHNHQTLGIIGLGNRKGGYRPEDVETVEALGQAIIQALMYQRAALALRRSEYRLNLALENAGAGMWIRDPVIGFCTTSKVNALFGRTPADPPLQEHEFATLIHPDDFPGIQKSWRDAIAKDGVYDKEYRVIWPDGSVHWLASKGKVYAVTADSPQFVGITFDITEEKRIKNELEQRERNLITFIDNMPGFVYFKDLEDRMVFPNQKVCDLCDFTREELIGRTVYEEGQPKEFADKFYADDMRVMSTGEPLIVEEEILDHGRPITIATYKTALKDRMGNVTGLAGISLDITERKRMEEALHHTALIAEKHAGELDAVISSIAEGVVVYDLSGNITRMNDFARNKFGYSGNEYQTPYQERSINLKIYKAEGTPYEAEEIPLYRALQGTIVRGEEVLFYRNGCPIWISATLAPIHDSHNNPKGVVFTFSDITERKRKVAEVLASERELLQVTLNSLGEAVMATDQKERIILMNEAAANLTGYSPLEAVGEPLQKVLYIVEDQTSEPITEFQKEFQHPILVSRDLTEIPIALNHAPIKTPDGLIIGTVMVFQDISEQQKIHQELLKTEKLESLGILAGGIAHDFNNILAAILANVQLALMKLQRNEDIQSYLVKTVETTRKASELTKQLLTFSKGGAPVRKDAALNNLIKDTAEFALRGAQVKAEFVIPDDLWAARIDEGQISQVIQNLTINAKQAMPRGGIVRFRAANMVVGEDSRFNPGYYVKITVQDQGVGISKENLTKIFDPFFTTKMNGNGLGLTTSYSIIHRHSGYIEVESQENEGTSFYIYLPASGAMLIPPVPQKEIAASKNPLKILIMDDEENILNAVGEILKDSFGYQVELALDGATAIELYQRAQASGEPFDVAVIDLTVPGGMGGQETIVHLRDFDPKVKAIVSSGYATDPIMADYEHFGFVGVISKPYKIDELREVIQNILEGK